MTPESVGHCQIYRVQPELGNLVAMFDMDVRRLRSFSTKEEEAESTQQQDGRHEENLSLPMDPVWRRDATS